MFLVKSSFVVDIKFTTKTLGSEASECEAPGQKYVLFQCFVSLGLSMALFHGEHSVKCRYLFILTTDSLTDRTNG